MKKRNSVVNLTTVFGAIIILMPLVWMILTSFKSFHETLQSPPTILPHQPTIENYMEVTERLPLAQLTWNTMFTIFMSIIIGIIICSLAAYALAILKIPGRRIMIALILLVSMIPGEIYIIPVYGIMTQLGLTNSLWAIIIPHSMFGLGILLLYQGFKNIPASYIESARIDGASWFRIYFRVALPLIKSSVVSFSIINALGVWKDVLWPIIAIRELENMTLGPGLAMLQGAYFTEYNLIMAADVLAIIPMLFVFILLQRQFVKTVTDSGIR